MKNLSKSPRKYRPNRLFEEQIKDILWLVGVACTQKMEERGGKGNLNLDARHTFMSFSVAAGREIHSFFLICCSLAVLWFLEM